jgi:hypothetical protein
MVFFSRPPPEADVFDPPQAVTRAALRRHERRARRDRRCLMAVLTGVIVRGEARGGVDHQESRVAWGRRVLVISQGGYITGGPERRCKPNQMGQIGHAGRRPRLLNRETFATSRDAR